MRGKIECSVDKWLTENLRELGYSKQAEYDFSVGNVYEIHAVAVWCDAVFFQIVGDSESVGWAPAAAFSLTDAAIPADWIINCLDSEVPLILGPAFVAESKDSYAAMVELHSSQVCKFHERLKMRQP